MEVGGTISAPFRLAFRFSHRLAEPSASAAITSGGASLGFGAGVHDSAAWFPRSLRSCCQIHGAGASERSSGGACLNTKFHPQTVQRKVPKSFLYSFPATFRKSFLLVCLRNRTCLHESVQFSVWAVLVILVRSVSQTVRWAIHPSGGYLLDKVGFVIPPVPGDSQPARASRFTPSAFAYRPYSGQAPRPQHLEEEYL